MEKPEKVEEPRIFKMTAGLRNSIKMPEAVFDKFAAIRKRLDGTIRGRSSQGVVDNTSKRVAIVPPVMQHQFVDSYSCNELANTDNMDNSEGYPVNVNENNIWNEPATVHSSAIPLDSKFVTYPQSQQGAVNASFMSSGPDTARPVLPPKLKPKMPTPLQSNTDFNLPPGRIAMTPIPPPKPVR